MEAMGPTREDSRPGVRNAGCISSDDGAWWVNCLITLTKSPSNSQPPDQSNVGRHVTLAIPSKGHFRDTLFCLVVSSLLYEENALSTKTGRTKFARKRPYVTTRL